MSNPLALAKSMGSYLLKNDFSNCLPKKSHLLNSSAESPIRREKVFDASI